MRVVKLESKIKPSALVIAMGYQGISITKLCENVKDLYCEDVSRFLEGYTGTIPQEKLKEIMQYLEWSYEFLYKEIKPLNKSLTLTKKQ